VAVAVVVKDGEVLIVCRRGEDGHGISWQFPAGIVKPGVTSEEAAVFETYAETGVHCTARCMLGSRVHPVTNVVFDYFLCDYLTGTPQNSDVVENLAVTWIEKIKLTQCISPDKIFSLVLEALNLVSESGANHALLAT
jgi:8-oxo-dGTP pyrophosphatase MutT (NUDIX family)